MEVTGPATRELVVWNKDNYQGQVKGKRTKRSRLPSPLRLSMDSSSSSAGDHYSGGSSSVVDMATTLNNDHQLRVSTTSEEEDMANCLILLAQGRNNNNNTHHRHHHEASLYQCKTCDRCFPSFQALGGHRASHKKPKLNNHNSEVKFQSFREENHHHDQPYDHTGTSFVLSLQISNSNGNNNNKSSSKIHECSICGAEFTSGQALGGHMRRHRTLVNNSATTRTDKPATAAAAKNVLKLDLNLPAPEDDHRESKLPFQSKENVLVFSSSSSLVDCHY